MRLMCSRWFAVASPRISQGLSHDPREGREESRPGRQECIMPVSFRPGAILHKLWGSQSWPGSPLGRAFSRPLRGTRVVHGLKKPPGRRLRARLPNAAYFLRRELCSRVSDTDLCRKPGQNPIPEGKIGPKTNEFVSRLRLNRRGPGDCIITAAKSVRYWARLPAPQVVQTLSDEQCPRHIGQRGVRNET
jgi:hypothetical protein